MCVLPSVVSENQSGGRETSQREHTDRAADVAEVSDEDYWALDQVSAQEYSGSVRTVWPQPFARRSGIEHTTPVKAVIHMPTGALVSLPPGTTLEEFLEAIR